MRTAISSSFGFHKRRNKLSRMHVKKAKANDSELTPESRWVLVWWPLLYNKVQLWDPAGATRTLMLGCELHFTGSDPEWWMAGRRLLNGLFTQEVHSPQQLQRLNCCWTPQHAQDKSSLKHFFSRAFSNGFKYTGIKTLTRSQFQGYEEEPKRSTTWT